MYFTGSRRKMEDCFSILGLLGKQRTGVAILNSTHYCSKTGTE